MEIISDGLLELATNHNIGENYDQNVTIHSWGGESTVSHDDPILVLDLDLSSYAGESDTVPVLNGNSGTLKEILSNLHSWSPRYLERGGVIIVLLGDPVKVAGWSQANNYGWLNNLQIANISTHGPRRRISISEAGPIEDYFEFVDATRFGIRLNEQVVTNPENYAIHSLDYELMAAAVSEYADPNGVRRSVQGSLVLLPPPTHPNRDFFGLLDTLNEIGQMQFQQEADPLGQKLSDAEIQKILDRGETQEVELKREFPDSGKRLAKEVVAFANRTGGLLIIGADDDGELVGLEDAGQTLERVTGSVQDNVTPLLDINAEIRTIGDEDILLISIPEATNVPHSMDGKYYLRDNNTIRDLDPNALKKWFDF